LKGVSRGGLADVIRVHLTAEDLLRVRVASHPAPLIEVGYALAAMHRQDPVFGTWRWRAATRLPRAACPLLDLVPASATGPLFLDPISTDLPEGLDMVQRSPAGFVTAELQRVTGNHQPPSWVRLLADRDRQSWRDLNTALQLTYRHLLAEAWPRVWSGFRSDLAWRSTLMTERGAGAALSTLHPAISWSGTVLQIDTPTELDIHPCGAGLTLLPSLLWTGRPQIGDHPDGSTVVVYPALTPLPLIETQPSDPLSGLLGRTRAAVLQLTLAQHTTTELAVQLGISAASVSGHTKALRAAGLTVSTRAGKAVLHSITPLGRRLLGTTGTATDSTEQGQRPAQGHTAG